MPKKKTQKSNNSRGDNYVSLFLPGTGSGKKTLESVSRTDQPAKDAEFGDSSAEPLPETSCGRSLYNSKPYREPWASVLLPTLHTPADSLMETSYASYTSTASNKKSDDKSDSKQKMDASTSKVFSPRRRNLDCKAIKFNTITRLFAYTGNMPLEMLGNNTCQTSNVS